MADQTAWRKDDCSKLEQELLQREAELAIINSVQQGLASHLEVQAIYDLVGEKIREIFNAQVVMVSIYDQEADTIEHRYAIERGQRVYDPGPHPPGGFRAKIIRTRQPILENTNVAEKAARLGQPTLPGTVTPKSWLGVPMFVGSQVTGVLSLQNVERENAFSISDVRLAQTIAASMSVALENARLFDQTQHLLIETKRRAAELQIINSVQEGLAQKLDMQSICDLVGEKIRQTFNKQAQTVYFAFYDAATDLADFPYIYQKGEVRRIKGWKPDGPLSRKLIETRETVFIRCAGDFEAYGLTSELINSAIFVPIMAGMDIHGIVSVQNFEREFAFTDSDVRLLETLANSISVALENARLWEQENLYRQALEREFEIGREIQAGFLPDILPQPKGWEIAASLRPAREVAGDFYDVFKLPNGRVGLVIADVCDKGLGAALFMTLFRSLLRAGSNLDFFARAKSGTRNSSAVRLMNAISLTNNYIAETHGSTSMFATIFFGILDTHTGVLAYINAGHLPPVMINQQGVKDTLTLTGPAVGAMPDMDYTIRKVMIEPGDVLFAYTDGLTDTINLAGERLSEEGLIPLVGGSQPLASSLAQIQVKARQFAAGTKQIDDITLLAVRRKE